MKHGISKGDLKRIIEDATETPAYVHACGSRTTLYEGLEYVAQRTVGPLAEAMIVAGRARVIGRLALDDVFTPEISVARDAYLIDTIVSEAFLPGDEYGDFFDKDLPQIKEEQQEADRIAQGEGLEFDAGTCTFCYRRFAGAAAEDIDAHLMKGVRAVHIAFQKFQEYLASRASPLHRSESDIAKASRELLPE